MNLDIFKINKGIPSLDGIRAIAVSIVILSHAGFGDVIPGGFGVTLFFFLSGYLITHLLMTEHLLNNKVNITGFFARRLIRILPPLFIILTAFYILDHFLRPAVNYDSGGILSQYFFMHNYYRVLIDGLTLPGSGVLWSLAVEEHYYIVFPFLFVLFFSLTNSRRKNEYLFILALGSIALTTLLWRSYLYSKGASQDRIYFSTDTRIDSILYGAIFAVVFSRKKITPDLILGKIDFIVLTLTAIAILMTFIFRNDEFRWVYRFSVQGLLLFPVFYYAIFYSKSRVFSILNSNTLQIIGVLSYAMYLSHAILIHLAEDLLELDEKAFIAIFSFFASLAVALVIYIYVERPLSSLRSKFNRKPKETLKKTS